jgi:hypothetical protein
MHFRFLSKVPVNEPHPGSPTGPLWRELPVYRAFITYLKFLIKIFLNKEMFSSSQRTLERSVLHVSAKRGPYGNRRPFPDPYLAYLSGSPLKEPSLHVPLVEPPHRETPHTGALLHSSVKVRCMRAPFRFPSGAPMEVCGVIVALRGSGHLMYYLGSKISTFFPHSVFICFLSQHKHQLFRYTAVTDWFL